VIDTSGIISKLLTTPNGSLLYSLLAVRWDTALSNVQRVPGTIC